MTELLLVEIGLVGASIGVLATGASNWLLDRRLQKVESSLQEFFDIVEKQQESSDRVERRKA